MVHWPIVHRSPFIAKRFFRIQIWWTMHCSKAITIASVLLLWRFHQIAHFRSSPHMMNTHLCISRETNAERSIEENENISTVLMSKERNRSGLWRNIHGHMIVRIYNDFLSSRWFFAQNNLFLFSNLKFKCVHRLLSHICIVWMCVVVLYVQAA